MKKTLLILFLITLSVDGFSQFFTEKTGNKLQKGITKFEGYFTFYYNDNSDKIFLEIDTLEEEFLYVRSLSEGVGSNDIGLDRGQLGGGVVVYLKKAGNKLLLIQPNLEYRAITDNKEEKESVKEAFAKSVLHGFTIKETKKGVYLVDATDFFIRDAHGVSAKLVRTKQGSYSLDKSKSAFNIKRTKAFPKNVEFDVLLTFKGTAKGGDISSVSPNASLVTVNQHHSFVELPDNKYKPRKFDPRSGGYPMSYLDYATPVNEPIKMQFIRRHRLEKKNPEAVISEAKEPIIYYLDRGTPEPVRSALLEGGRWWNQAFESIGYKNAFQMKMLPEGADPLDVRYNMVQWVHRSTRGWSYGASISDPRTGEIIKGHVSLGSLRIRQDFLIAQALQAPYANNNSDDSFALEMAVARIRQLSAHEIGHTLGFAHNFAASTNGRASVMDYPHPKFTLKGGKIDFSNAYDNKIGDWDKVIVAYFYQDFKTDEENELNKIIENATAKGFKYLSDADSRSQGSASASSHLWDNGGTIYEELYNLLEIRKMAIANFSTDNIKTNQPYSVLEDVFVPLYFFHRFQTEATVKLIGGLEYSYAVKGGKETVVKRVSGSLEKIALEAVLKTIAVDEIAIPKEKLALFPPRAMGFGRTRESFKSNLGVEFDAFGAVETASEMTLNLLLNPQRASRLIAHKSLDENQLGLDELIDKLISKSIKKTHKDSYYQELQNVINTTVLEQLFYLASYKNQYKQVNAIVLFKLDEIKSILENKKSKGVQKIYDIAMIKMIDDFKKKPTSFKKTKALQIPDGSPIGTDYKY
ncbi:zinc-dependent metalloprotease [Polaribacter sp. HaHaR_3_91]|uniref:zinc-dependent metalloprotease n=1 Tax=Polaribacter sp. HaHaR_3_91 TaxID=2745561 RepID=UPI001C4E34E9|nr:zinc-dependent metalloprotease [Polaribacter sp. HaHaR_3_91]QXP62449.1 zinc-dependent metalloprotease [Polaribacter sp. HaHaR_3_91]